MATQMVLIQCLVAVVALVLTGSGVDLSGGRKAHARRAPPHPKREK